MIDISDDCYKDIEIWLEEIYKTYPFQRIFENGVRLGYKGFIRNFELSISEPLSGVVEVKVISKSSGDIRHLQTFDKNTGQIGMPGHLL
jgi:hypothetical protein